MSPQTIYCAKHILNREGPRDTDYEEDIVRTDHLPFPSQPLTPQSFITVESSYFSNSKPPQITEFTTRNYRLPELLIPP